MSAADDLYDALAVVQALPWEPGTPRARAVAGLERVLRDLINHAGPTDRAPESATLEAALANSMAAAHSIVERTRHAAEGARLLGDSGAGLDAAEAVIVTKLARLLEGRWRELSEALLGEQARATFGGGP